MPDWKVKLFKEEIAKKEDTITVFSKNYNWLTINPKDEDRRKALEKMRVLNMEVTSKLMPQWMQTKHKGEKNKNKDVFMSVEYNNPLKQKPKRMMAFIDKNLNPCRLKPIEYNPSRSVFNFHDFRHNVCTKKESDYYGSQVSQEPRKFFDWDDGKKFNPKFKKDI